MYILLSWIADHDRVTCHFDCGQTRFPSINRQFGRNKCSTGIIGHENIDAVALDTDIGSGAAVDRIGSRSGHIFAPRCPVNRASGARQSPEVKRSVAAEITQKHHRWKSVAGKGNQIHACAAESIEAGIGLVAQPDIMARFGYVPQLLEHVVELDF